MVHLFKGFTLLKSYRLIFFVILSSLFLSLLPGCGGGNKTDTTKVSTTTNTNTNTNTSIGTAAFVEILTSSDTLASSGGEVTITVFVKDAANIGLSGQTVQLQASSGTLLATLPTVTDLTGAVTAKLNAGADRSRRTITVTASVKGNATIIGKADVQVQDAIGSIELVPSSTTLSTSGDEVTLTAYVKNSSAIGIAGQTVQFQASSGTLQVASPSVTDSTGAVTAKLTAGADKSLRTITVSASVRSGTTIVGSTNILVKDAGSMIEVTSSSSTLASTGDEVTITALVKNANNIGLADQTVQFEASDGALVVTLPTTTNSAGIVTAKLTAGVNKSVRPITVTVTAMAKNGTTITGSTSVQVRDATTIAAIPSTIDLLRTSTSLASSGDEVTITALVKNSANIGLANQPVQFLASSGVLQVASPSVTDATGTISAKLSAGGDKTLRTITVTVKTGTTVSNTMDIPVLGSTITIAGRTSLQQSATNPSIYAIRALDSIGSAIPNIPITVSSALGNPISISSSTTDASGNRNFDYTPSNAGAGSDTITVTGLGGSFSSSILINTIDFTVLSHAAGSSIAVDTKQTITVRYQKNGSGVKDQTVQFSTTRGTITATSTTDNYGDATATLESTTAGPASITASITGVGDVTLPLQIAAGPANKVILQASPTAVLPNSVGSTANQSTIEALVLDAKGNAVTNTLVNFTISTDLSYGNLSSGVATTDQNGRARVQFIPGSASTATDGVSIGASSGGVTATDTKLTVNGDALFISMSFGNTIESADKSTYSKTFSVYVTDANGIAVPNRTISLSAIPLEFNKGELTYTASQWRETKPESPSIKMTCANEDINKNGKLDPGEDKNNNGQLTPGNIATLVPGSVRTDAFGRASFDLQYGKNFAMWVRVEITAQSIVNGTESKQILPFRLLAGISDLSEESLPPANHYSPFGSLPSSIQDCADPN